MLCFTLHDVYLLYVSPTFVCVVYDVKYLCISVFEREKINIKKFLPSLLDSYEWDIETDLLINSSSDLNIYF